MEEECQPRFGRRSQAPKRPMTARELRIMLGKEKTASEVLLRISREDGSLENLLSDNNLDATLVIRVLHKAITDTEGSQREAVNTVLQTFVFCIHSHFHERLERCLRHSDPEVLKDLLNIMKKSLHSLPNAAARAFHYLHHTTVHQAVMNASHHDLIILHHEVLDLINAPSRCAERQEEAQRNCEMRQRDNDIDPGQFRGLSIIPTAEDFDAQQDIRVRANKLKGEYDSVNDYLDIQFRLLRADLILPLRESILEYQAQGGEEHKHYFKSIKVYTQVRVVRPVCHDKGLCFRLSFDVSKIHVDWSMSQRLKYGSLLCLSSDNFQNYRCAVVENRDPKDLAKGLVDVQFINSREGAEQRLEEFMTVVEESRCVRYVMVESPSYFEAYTHVLRGLQNITEENFPFWQYIGQCHDNINPPHYILEQGVGTTMDLRPLIDKSFKIKNTLDPHAAFSQESEVAAAVEIANKASWPSRNVFDLDISQFGALQSALTEEFSLIQGPPGTGKTFIGLMITKALLHNKHLWTGQNGEQSPILLVCYTNHALDQFLEGVLDFFEGNLVRVGSRSKSERLEDYNLRSLRHRARKNMAVPVAVHVGKVEARNKLKAIKAEIQLEAGKLEMLEREIVTENFLRDFMSEKHFDGLKRKSCENLISEWLGITAETKRIEQEGLKRKWTEQRQTEARPREGEDALQNENEDDEAEEEEEEVEDIDLFEEAIPDALRHLDINDVYEEDFEDIFDLFGELMGIEEEFENIRRVNQRLDEVDQEVEKMRRTNIAFNVSEFGEEEISLKLSKDEKAAKKAIKHFKECYRMKLLDHMQKAEKMEEEEVFEVEDIWKLRRSDRWRLYHYWVDAYCRQLRGAVRDKSQDYERVARRYQEILHQEDKSILETATIIGMTTSGAARYQAVLRDIGPKIIIVEEAAEVLEGHVITSLSAQSQHVVLIGDHKQLRPNPSVHKLKMQFGIDISLFERLLNNNYPLHVLQYQHRMRPEISHLLKIRDLYPDLQDHDSVKHYKHVRGVNGDVRFIYHTQNEEAEGDMKTFKNPHEAHFVFKFFLYLIQQGCNASRITILSPYAGQVRSVKKLMMDEGEVSRKRKVQMKGVKVVSVDNYQGEENDIVILSLVRSNEDNAMGFLKVNNRLCVALSRAKIGLYVIGDLVGLAKASALFKEILARAGTQGFVGDHIELMCTRHKEKRTVVRDARDFKNVPEGGCNKPCTIRLHCGHTCGRICHTEDENHVEFKCQQMCRALCETCNKPCCGKHSCGSHTKCENFRDKVVPNCGHTQKVPCYLDPNQYECEAPCDGRLPCGHECPMRCGERHQHSRALCRVIVETKSNGCGHEFSTECRNTQADGDESCTQLCQTILECGHKCPGTCGQCFNGRLHLNCEEPCSKGLICGHPCMATCGDCPPCRRQCENKCVHSECPKLCGEPCAECLETCNWSCRHTNCSELCCQPCQRDPCDACCPLKLRCGHNCAGLCGEKCPRLCSVCPGDKKELMEINGTLAGYDGDPNTIFIELDCGHVWDVDFMDQWIATSTVSAEDEGQKVIGMKTCPYCRSAIRKCNRYNKQIKEMLRLIERVKRKYIGEKEKVSDLQRRRDGIARLMFGLDRLKADSFLARGPAVLSETILEAQISQLKLYNQLCALRRIATEGENRWPHRGSTFREIQAQLGHFIDWTLKARSLFSKQNLTDAKREHRRLMLLVNLHTLRLTIDTLGISAKIPERIMNQIGPCIKALSVNNPVDPSVLDDCSKLFEELKELVPKSSISLTAEEKLQIVQAMSLQRGAWYKCPKGHIYAIGECGQAMEESKCPECDSTIGGTNHSLNPTNAWAPEMDNAEVPIWNNMEADRQMAEQLQRELNEQLDFM